jgi:signal transduction histidine kinase
LREYDIVEILEKVIRLHGPAAELKKVKFIFDPGESGCLINTDKQYLQQIVSNIMQNAVHFAPKNSSITIELVESEKTLSISITDEGQGITESDQKRLFGGYKKMSGEDGIEKPSGIGLAIVYRLLEKLHGKIDIKSVFGHGTTITVELNK